MAPRSFFIRELLCKNYPNSGLQSNVDGMLIIKEMLLTNEIRDATKEIIWTIHFILDTDGKNTNYSGTIIDKKGAAPILSAWQEAIPIPEGSAVSFFV